MWIDAHQSVIKGDIRKMASEALDEGRIKSPAIANIFYDEQWNPQRVTGSNHLFFPSNASILPHCKDQYSFTPASEPLAIGVGLCMSRQTYMAVGGWNRYQGRHGAQERGMALKAYMADISVELDPNVVLGHEFFGESHPSRNASTELYRYNNLVPSTYNTWHAFMSVCSPSFFTHHIQPWLLSYEGVASGEKGMHYPLAVQDRDYFLRHCKRRPDGDLMKLITSLACSFSPQKDPGTAALEPMALNFLNSLARGRCLECGTGSTIGTQAILHGAISVVSIDHMEKYSIEASKTLNDERVQFMHCPINPETGFYDVSKLNGQFDFILIDGPPGTQARRLGVKELMPLLAPDGIILVDDAKRDTANIQQAQHDLGFKVEMLPTKRGLAKLTRL